LKEDKTAFGELFAPLGPMVQQPRKPQLLHFYSGRYYETRIKSRVEARLDTLRRRAEFSGEKLPHKITVQNDITKECWEEESEPFQQETIRALDRHHEITLKAWREAYSDSPARTPEDYHA
jgi:ribosome-binding protein aMBF1 (putative translation factor)